MSSKEKNGSEKIRKLAKFKEMVEQKIAEAELNLEDLKLLLEFVNETLLDKGFKRAETIKGRPVKTQTLPPIPKDENVVPLRDRTGDGRSCL